MVTEIGSGQPHREATSLLAELETRFEAIDPRRSPDETAASILALEADARKQLESLRSRYRVAKPRGVGLSKRLRSDWDSYLREADTLETEVFSVARQRLDEITTKASASASVALDRRRRAEAGVRSETESARRAIRESKSRADMALHQLVERVTEITQHAMRDVDTTIAECTAALASSNLAELSDKRFRNERIRLEERIVSVVERRRAILERLMS